MKQRLLEVERAPKPKLSRCRDLVPVERDTCFVCGGPIRHESIGQPALFRHGGYGATRMTTFAICTERACRAVRIVRTIEVRPDRREARPS